MVNRHNKGFTIIEVVLVLAIAGLVFLMVFIALPALQAAQRDTQRRADVAIVIAAVKNYTKNNHGKAPPDSGNGSDILSPDGYGDWVAASPSQPLKRYLVDLDPGNVTKVVAVHNLIEKNRTSLRKNRTSLRYRIDNNGVAYHDVVSVVVGSKCPDLSSDTIQFINTGHRTDIAVVRFMERGYWYCQEV